MVKNSCYNSSLTCINDGLEEVFKAISRKLRLLLLRLDYTEGSLTHSSKMNLEKALVSQGEIRACYNASRSKCKETSKGSNSILASK